MAMIVAGLSVVRRTLLTVASTYRCLEQPNPSVLLSWSLLLRLSLWLLLVQAETLTV